MGDWTARTTSGSVVKSSYKLISNDSALVETYLTPSGRETITVYHPDGSSLLLTHYCAQGNQARLRVASASESMATFQYLDATNLRNDQAVLAEAKLRFLPEGFEQTETYREPTGEKEMTVLQFRRAKEDRPNGT